MANDLSLDLTFLARAAKYTDGKLSHQNEAFDYLQSKTSSAVLTEFVRLFRQPESIGSDSAMLPRFPLISQRDAIGDRDRDGTLDKWQTCNVTCCAMVIQYLTGNAIASKELDDEVRFKFGSRYVHSNLVKLLRSHGVKSSFDVSTTHEEIKNCLSEGNPVIWSNKLTRGGHLVVITGFDDDNLCYRIHDPYGEPFAVSKDKTKWQYKDIRKPYLLSYAAFDVVNANGAIYNKKEHWCHLCSKI